MAPLVIYHAVHSRPSRTVLMTIKALNLNCELREINLFKNENLSDDFLKVNPQHTVPTLVEGEFILWDSHAIVTYLVDKYGKDDSFYSKDLRKRAVVNQRLHFENGILTPLGKSILSPIYYKNATTVSPDSIVALKEAYSFLEKFLEGRSWMAGNNVTVADFSIISSISVFNIIEPVDPQQYPNLAAWTQNVQNLSYFEASQEGLDVVRQILTKKLNIQ